MRWMSLEPIIEQSKPEREKQIYINIHMRNLKKKNWYRQSYLQSRNRDTDVKKTTHVPSGERGWEELGDWNLHKYTTMYKIDN